MNTYKAEEQKLYCSQRLQLTNRRRKITMEIRYTINITFRQSMGWAGSDHFIISRLKLQPKRKTGRVKLLEHPTRPESPVNTVNIFHPIVSSVKLPRHHSSNTPSTKEVMSWQMNGAVNSLQNSKCFRCSGSSTSPSNAKVGIFRKGGQGMTKVTQTMTLMKISRVVSDFNLQYGASRFVIISTKVSGYSFYSPSNSCGGLANTLQAVIFAITYIALIIIIMNCCENSTVKKEGNWRESIKESKESEPLKFKLLGMLGLKEYLIDKYVFLRSQPQYQIVEREGVKEFVSDNPIKYPEEYTAEVTMVEDANHSIPAVMLSLNNREHYCGTVIYSHGNSSDMLNSLYFICKFAKNFPRFDYLVYDYTGYGQSKKASITEFSISEDLRLLIDTIKVPDEQIILWGFSLGTFPTSKVAAKRNFKGVILQSPLASVYSLFSTQLSPYSSFQNDCFNLMDHITQINSFLIIAHSKDDQIVPFSHAKALFQRYQMVNSNPFCFLFEVTGLKHNHMHAYLCDSQKNEVKDSFLAYLRLIIEQSALPTTRMFQLTKNKYFDNLGLLSQAEYIDTADKDTKETTKDMNLTLVESFNFQEIKRERVFQIDDITTQTGIDFNYYMDVKADKHSQYFSVSKQAREETEFDTILNEDQIPSVYE